MSECKYKNNGFREISNNLYPKYIENDDKNLLKLIKNLLIIYKRYHYKLLLKMFHKWEIISYKIKFNMNNELNKELEEPKLEKRPKIYSKIMKEEDKEKKKIKKLDKNEIYDDNIILKNKTFNEKNIDSDIKEIENEEEIIKENNSKDLIEYDKINENDIIDIKDKDNNFKNDINYNIDKGINRSKSVDKFKNISLKVEKPKKWEYSYYRKENNEDNMIMKLKNKKRLMSDLERQQLFNNLYNDCQKRKEKYNKLKMEKEAKFNTLYTFTPKIFQNKLNEKYMKNMADSKFYTKSNSNINITDNNIINNTTASNNIGNIINSKIEENKAEIPLNFISRLSEYEKIKKQNLEKIRNEIYIKYEKIPNKNRKSFDRINNHLLNNSENFLEIKQKNIEKIKQDMYKEQGITFQPKTNKIFNNKIKNDIIERNNEFMKEKKEKLEKYSLIKEKECTFKPKINSIETSNNKENKFNISYKTDQNSSDVSKRLFDYQKKYNNNLEDIRSKYKENYSFNPIISKNTQSILNNRKKLKEKIEEKLEKKIINENTNYELIRKQIKLGELEELSKKLEEIKNDNLEINEAKTTNNIENSLNKNKKNKNILNDKNYINDNNENSNKIMELANNLVNNNKLTQEIKMIDKKENTNDFISLMNNKGKNISQQKNKEFDFEKLNGSKQIMNLNYYDNLL